MITDVCFPKSSCCIAKILFLAKYFLYFSRSILFFVHAICSFLFLAKNKPNIWRNLIFQKLTILNAAVGDSAFSIYTFPGKVFQPRKNVIISCISIVLYGNWRWLNVDMLGLEYTGNNSHLFSRLEVIWCFDRYIPLLTSWQVLFEIL